MILEELTVAVKDGVNKVKSTDIDGHSLLKLNLLTVVNEDKAHIRGTLITNGQ